MYSFQLPTKALQMPKNYLFQRQIRFTPLGSVTITLDEAPYFLELTGCRCTVKSKSSSFIAFLVLLCIRVLANRVKLQHVQV
mmetsp:Transcript_6063/g.8413  ORF Transcript_6063/g.8413 Transcript_6063/m.8413 type:complete len:82 (-) Transcript_6063:474-719(-)